MDEVIDWLTFYNHSRLHSALNYMCPMQLEQRWLGSKKVSIITHAMDSINSGQGQSVFQLLALPTIWMSLNWGIL